MKSNSAVGLTRDRPHAWISRPGAANRGRIGSVRRAFTLAESLLAAVILVGAVAAGFTAISAGHVQSHYVDTTQGASRLAQALIERIVALPYDDPNGPSSLGPEAGETHWTLFDNADDYHGFTEEAGQLRDRAGLLYPADFQSLRRTVSAAYVNQSVPGLGASPIQGLNVTVTVRDKRGNTWTAKRFIRKPYVDN